MSTASITTLGQSPICEAQHSILGDRRLTDGHYNAATANGTAPSFTKLSAYLDLVKYSFGSVQVDIDPDRYDYE